jgi:hypothetical protein
MNTVYFKTLNENINRYKIIERMLIFVLDLFDGGGAEAPKALR